MVNKYVSPTPTASGVYSFSFTNESAPTHKLAGIKVSSTTGVAFNLIVANLVAYKESSVNIENSTADDENAIVDVYNIYGHLVKKQVLQSDATSGLDKGIYLVGSKKVLVK